MEYGQNNSIGLGGRSVEVLLTLREEIEHRKFFPGQKIPTEPELGKRFNVSITTIRRSIKHLIKQGYLLSRQGSGTYVCEQAPEASGNRIISMMYCFKTDLLTAVQNYLLKKRYLLCVYSQIQDDWDSKVERIFLEQVKSEGHRALLAHCTPTAPRNDDVLSELVDSGIRVIHVEHFRMELPVEEYILPDYRKAGYMAAVELLLAGYRHIIFASLNIKAPYSQIIYQSTSEALREHSADYDSHKGLLQVPSQFFREPKSNYKLIAMIREFGDSVGFVCVNLYTAQLICDILQERGIKIPQDVGVISQEIHENPENYNIDYLCFDREGMLKRAMDAAMDIKSEKLQELVSPKIIRHGTIR